MVKIRGVEYYGNVGGRVEILAKKVGQTPRLAAKWLGEVITVLIRSKMY